MARLPNPGSDDGIWGTILNEFLLESHTTIGALKDGVVGTASVQDGAISEAKLDAGVQAKLNATGGGGEGITNLAITATSTGVTVTSDTGTDAAIPAATTSVAGVMAAADKTKLSGIATGATANSSDATLLNRTNHTGSQAISTVTGLQTALDGKQATGSYVTSGSLATVATSGSYNDLSNQPTLVPPSRTITGTTSLTGGGDLTANRTISLVNDSATPGNSKYYGTNGSGTKGYYDVPASGGGGVSSVNTRTGAVTLDKTDVGLAGVDNTSDVGKPVSTATQTALDGKVTNASGSSLRLLGYGTEPPTEGVQAGDWFVLISEEP